MCYIFCFSYPLDLRKKVLNPVTCWDRCTQKQTNLQIIWYFQDHHQIFFFNFKSQSPNFPVRHQLFSEDFDVVLMQPSHTHTHTHTYPHTKKRSATLQDRSFCASTGEIFSENLSIVEARSVIRAIFGKSQKTTSQSHPHLKPRNPGNSAEIFHWHSKLILYIARKRVFFSQMIKFDHIWCVNEKLLYVYIYICDTL